MSALTGVVKKVGKVLDDMATDLYELSIVTTTGSVTTIEIDDKKGPKKQHQNRQALQPARPEQQ